MISLPTPVQSLRHPLLEERGIQLMVKRDDLVHPEIMGNKWRKLKYNIQEAKKRGSRGIITLGGAFSNHIAATAAAAFENGLDAIGIIRGDELHERSNPTLQFASDKQMQLKFVSREAYRSYRTDPATLATTYTDYYFLPEGGTNQLAVKGCAEIIQEIAVEFDVIVSPIGSGGTLCGLISALGDTQKALGISSLKGSFIHNEVKRLLGNYAIDSNKYEIQDQYHFGGYAKTTPELIDFINWFKEYFKVPLDPIYTGKSFFAVWDMIKNFKFEKNLRIILLHTGGLQAIEGFNRKNQNIIQ